MLNKTEILAGINTLSKSKKYKWTVQHHINQNDILKLQDIIQEAIQQGYSKRSIYEYFSKKSLISMSQATFYRYCKTISLTLEVKSNIQNKTIEKQSNTTSPSPLLSSPATTNQGKKVTQQKIVEEKRKKLECSFSQHDKDLKALGLI